MTDNALLYLGSTLAQVTVASIGLGAVFFGLLSQKADTTAALRGAILKKQLAPLDFFMQRKLLLEGNIWGYLSFLKREESQNPAVARKRVLLEAAGANVYWAGVIKRKLHIRLLGSIALGLPALALSVTLIVLSDELKGCFLGTTLSAILIILFAGSGLFTVALIWVGALPEQSISVPPDVPKPGIAFFSSRRVLAVYNLLFLGEPFGWPFHRVQRLRRLRRYLLPHWYRWLRAFKIWHA